MWISQLLCAVIGLSCGLIVAGGVFALITSIGVIPRMAGKSHTGKYVRVYEMSVFFGGCIGNIIFIYKVSLPLGILSVALFGLFSGVFVGCLATSLAETLNTTAVFSRRINLTMGMGFIILCLALGKFFGSMMYFYHYWFIK